MGSNPDPNPNPNPNPHPHPHPNPHPIPHPNPNPTPNQGDGALLTLGPEQTSYLADSGVAFTDDQYKFGREATGQPATLRAIYTAAGFVEAVEADAEATLGLVLDRTSFFSQASWLGLARGLG